MEGEVKAGQHQYEQYIINDIQFIYLFIGLNRGAYLRTFTYSSGFAD